MSLPNRWQSVNVAEPHLVPETPRLHHPPDVLTLRPLPSCTTGLAATGLAAARLA
eukprot:CAMPEP_0194562878 /NCGR_PEP_ID=MMETSP0292-20121207/3155_1 /TAXON_ID=39354 /ORGANISM="Heterosigma akashiwo, Strain CCMP2393" /LENGTH=54 /DNA_ID=CAMNT_0039411691 /DNA_START=109 /DNA_END=269 /DNA_ORIENTATION=+